MKDFCKWKIPKQLFFLCVFWSRQQQQTRITFCPFLELVGAFNAQTVPFIFYSTAMSLTLSVESADSFWNTMDKNV